MNNIHLRGLAVAVSALALLGGCASNSQRYNPNPPPSQYSNNAVYGYVQSVDLVRAESQTTGAGAVIGGVIGAVVGRQIGGGSGRGAATAIGAVGGALVGNQIEKGQRAARDFYRVSVRFDDGSQRQFDYENPVDVRQGDRVWVQNNQLMR